MRLQRLTGLEREKLESEYRELTDTIDRLESSSATRIGSWPWSSKN